jgi:hypothetical protein
MSTDAIESEQQPASSLQALRNWPRDNSEPEIWRLDFRLEIFSIGYVENGDASGVPRTTSNYTFACDLIVITIVIINIPLLTAVSTVDRLCPLRHVAGHMIDAVTVCPVF